MPGLRVKELTRFGMLLRNDRCGWSVVNGNQAHVLVARCVDEGKESDPRHCVLNLTQCTTLSDIVDRVPDLFGRVDKIFSE